MSRKGIKKTRQIVKGYIPSSNLLYDTEILNKMIYCFFKKYICAKRTSNGSYKQELRATRSLSIMNNFTARNPFDRDSRN